MNPSVAIAAASAATDLGGGLVLVVGAALLLLLATCFVKLSVVFAVLRAGLGGDGIPPRSVGTALALGLTLFVMAPVAEQIVPRVAPRLHAAASPADTVAALAEAREPLAAFLFAHTPERHRVAFVDLARSLRPPAERASVGERDLNVLVPAFLVGELGAAFQIGFLLLLPFLVVELVVGSLLAAMGLHALSPRAVSLPFKLLLFVVADGWGLLARGLVLGYGGP